VLNKTSSKDNMALLLNEEQTMLRDSAAAFLADKAPINALRKLRDERQPEGFSRQLWQQFHEMGFAGVLIPEAHGGLGLGMVEAGAILEQMGHYLSVSPFLASSVIAVTALRHCASDEQQAHWLPKLARGECLAALATDESSKHNPAHIATVARQDGGHWVLDGQKTFVAEGHVADLLIVTARLSSQMVGLFLVPRNTPGVSVEPILMVDARMSARITLQSVRLEASALLSGTDPKNGLQITLDTARAACAAELLGIADEAFERTTQYLKERKQFGKLIGEFQALQHRAATLFCDIELARAALAKALSSLDRDASQAAQAVAVAKARMGASATLAVQEGVQMHGGMGMTDQFDMGLFLKRARVLQEMYGDHHYHQDRLARMNKY
jgi:alkylation response protein AidB-like acyl-CoA dehydrogenase